MSWSIVTIQNRPDGPVEHCVAVDSTTIGNARILQTATGDPEQLRPADRLAVEQKGFTEALAIAEIVFPNVEVQLSLVRQKWDSEQEAINAAAKLIATAHGWREPDPDIPEVLRAAVTALPEDVQAVRDQVLEILDRLSTQVADLQTQLTRKIVLGPQGGSPNPADPSRDPRKVVDQFLLSRSPRNGPASPAGEALGPRHKRDRSTQTITDGTGIAELLLGRRIETDLSLNGIETVGQLRKLSNSKLKAIPGIGPKAVEKIADALGRPANTRLRHGSDRDANAASPAARRPETQPTMGEQYGTVQNWIAERRFGFVLNDSGDRFFVHASEIRTTGQLILQVGQRVQFTGEPHQRGPRAVEVWPV